VKKKSDFHSQLKRLILVWFDFSFWQIWGDALYVD